MSTLDRSKALRVAGGILQRQRSGPLADELLVAYLVDSIARCVTDDPQSTTDPALPLIIRDLRLGHASPAACADRLERLIPYDEPQTVDRDALTIILNLLVASGSVYPEDVQAAVDAILVLLGPDPRIAKIEALLAEPFPPNDFYVNGMPDQYAALAEFYDDDFATRLRTILRDDA